MKVILDIKDSRRAPFLMDMLKSLDYISVIKEVKEKRRSQLISDLAEAFEDVRLHEQGKKKLKFAKDLLNEL
jgi:hypothetical protein